VSITAVSKRIPDDVSDLPACAIDLGFSELESSVGVAFYPNDGNSPTENQFGLGVVRVNNWLRDLAQKTSPERAKAERANQTKCVLIVEAPLSMAMTQLGNPCHRQIELRRNYEKKASPRSPKGWYYQAGANLSVGSVVLLKALIVPECVDVQLIEGFYCSVSADESHSSHKDVAKDLLSRLITQNGEALVEPLAESDGGSVMLLPGLDGLVEGIPGVLLRDGLQLKPGGVLPPSRARVVRGLVGGVGK
jgi:hypothetical protein